MLNEYMIPYGQINIDGANLIYFLSILAFE